MKQTIRILLVDDDEDDRQFFAEALESLDLEAKLEQLIDGPALLQLLSNNSDVVPDIVFLDLNMPKMSGHDCLEQLRKSEQNKDLIVIIYSTSSAERDIEDTFRLGANAYLQKPSSFVDLKNSLKQVIEMNWTHHRRSLNKENFLLRI